MPKQFRRFLYSLTVLIAIGLFSVSTHANESKLNLEIRDLGCSIDQTHSGVITQSTLTPEECGHIMQNPEFQQGQTLDELSLSNPSSSSRSASENYRPGSQGIFENTVFEPLVYTAGYGNLSASNVRPILSSAILIAGSTMIIDGAFFELRFTQLAMSSLRFRYKNKA
jgi:hypothetical protein